MQHPRHQQRGEPQMQRGKYHPAWPEVHAKVQNQLRAIKFRFDMYGWPAESFDILVPGPMRSAKCRRCEPAMQGRKFDSARSLLHISVQCWIFCY
mmetsp:Transcript_76771/g.126638  ORF Transcript_76771/g.126638 Transcript_76771/m.126638 type:complete len:95 (-) Transcript_76771:650-934(-)